MEHDDWLASSSSSPESSFYRHPDQRVIMETSCWSQSLPNSVFRMYPGRCMDVSLERRRGSRTRPPRYIYIHSPHSLPQSHPFPAKPPSTKMKFLYILLFFPFLLFAAPVPGDDSDDPPFSVMAIRSGSRIHLQEMTASGLSFWIGGNTASYCPSMVEDCPPGDTTVFAPGGGALVSPPLRPSTHPPTPEALQQI